MKKKVILAVLSGTVAFSVQASDVTGIYLQGKLGTGIQHQSSGNMSATFVDVDDGSVEGPYKPRTGSNTKAVFAGGLSVGYDFNPQFSLPIRLEAEYIIRANGNSSIKSTSFPDADDSGSYAIAGKTKVNTQSWMFNGYYDIDTGTAFRPYVTAGLGIAYNRLKVSTYENVTELIGETSGDSHSFSENKGRFAWGIGAGLTYDIDKNWSVDLGYRFLDAGKVSASKSWFDSVDNDTAYRKASVKVRYHDILAGVRYTF